MTRAEVIDGSGEWLGHERGSVRYRLLLASLFCVGVATFAQLYSPQAVLASIGRGFGVTASSSALVISASTVGLAIGVLPWAAASDRWGRLRVMSIAVLGATILGLLVPWSPSFPLLLTGRFFEGLMIGGAPAVALAYLGEEVHAKDTARAAGTYVAGTTVGGLAGRIIAGSVANVAGWRLGVFVVALVCGAAAIAFVRLAPRPRRFVRADRGDRAARVSARLGQNLRSPRQLVLYAQGFLLMGGFVALYNFFGFRLTAAPLSVPPAVAEFAFVAYLAGTVTSSGVNWPRVHTAPHEFDWAVLDERLAYATEDLGLTVIADLVHYGTPTWLDDSFADPRYPDAVAEFAGAFAERYRGLVDHITPLNEPVTTASFCGLRGVWPPALTGWDGWATVVLGIVEGMARSIEAIRAANPEAVVVHVEASALYAAGAPHLGDLATHLESIGTLPTDLLLGRVTPEHELYDWLVSQEPPPSAWTD
ncbi:MFS transporter [Frondihabitans sucicola]|uniref:MFS transporter n=1 Tax=Frondihabitans sucicola TaxID=1268041 RepID=UPI0025740C75|nr:MFS transporter [Frondihabitans sucicola]